VIERDDLDLIIDRSSAPLFEDVDRLRPQRGSSQFARSSQFSYEFAGVGRQPRGRPASASGTRLEPERGSVPHAAENEAPREWGSRCSGSIEPDELGLPETPAARSPAALGNKGARLTL